MRILVATTKTQGRRKNDFCYVPEGEPVMAGSECHEDDIDGHCGCRRSMVGIKCHTGTTTVAVTETDMDREALIALYVKSGKDAGFNFTPAEIAPMANDILRIAGQFAVGTVLERRGDAFRVRAAGKE